MSYDVDLDCTCGQPCCKGRLLEWNYTSNCSPMWNAAGVDLQDFNGKTARECLLTLASAIETLRRNPEVFTSMNPENGWGSYETLVPALIGMRDAFVKFPDGIVSVNW